MTTHKMAAITGAVALSMAAASVHAENPFEVQTLAKGYQVADASDSKAKEGKCSSGKCGSNMKHGNTSGKTKEGACHHDKAKEGACSADKMKEGSCSAEKMKEGACHASK
ncbi:hypothetical protein [Methylophilus methylotrophus]|uniref:hypothetical protein n=1 Tax=Methylophilus methylotrophus TaxID=17 RepID=UPI000F59610A|nr:hypothetical protein [Methylophilus methylotrophus]